MADTAYNRIHLDLLNEGVDKWNQWRDTHPDMKPELRLAPLSGRNLRGVNLQGANLIGAVLNDAILDEAKLKGARLDRANLERARLKGVHLEDASLKEAWLGGADLRSAFFSNTTNLEGAYLYSMDKNGRTASLVDIDWASVNLGVIDWEQVQKIGDEQIANETRSTESYRAATRAYRQLVVELRNQGMGEEADRFAYKAQLLQRILYKRQKSWPKFIFSLFLDLLAGYGYKAGRSLIIYAIIIVMFAALYYILPSDPPLHLSWSQALLFSLTSFHGRVQLPTDWHVGDTFAWIAVIETLLGLLIELSFIATFTQRFFAR